MDPPADAGGFFYELVAMKRLPAIFALFLLFACNEHAAENEPVNDSPGQDGTELEDTLPKTRDTVVRDTAAPVGVYRGELPCDGCKALLHTVALYANGTYRVEEERRGSPLIKTAAGNWKRNGKNIELMEGANVTRQYTFKSTDLVFNTAREQFVLQKGMDPSRNKVWKDKGASGLEYYGIGNEPFWNIEIDEQKSITFRLADWEKAKSFPAVTPQVNGDSTVYTTANAGENLRVVIHNRFCSDGMSDHIYSKKIGVTYGAQKFSGCGISFRSNR
jgi:uncharacterized membrane protein